MNTSLITWIHDMPSTVIASEEADEEDRDELGESTAAEEDAREGVPRTFAVESSKYKMSRWLSRG